MRSLTGGKGADYSFEAAGRAELVAQAFEATRRAGTIVAVGVPGPDAAVMLPGPALVRHEKIVTGSLYGSCRPRQDMPRVLDLYATGKLPLDRLITRTYELEQINEAFHDMNSGILARGVVNFDGEANEQAANDHY